MMQDKTNIREDILDGDGEIIPSKLQAIMKRGEIVAIAYELVSSGKLLIAIVPEFKGITKFAINNHPEHIWVDVKKGCSISMQVYDHIWDSLQAIKQTPDNSIRTIRLDVILKNEQTDSRDAVLRYVKKKGD